MNSRSTRAYIHEISAGHTDDDHEQPTRNQGEVVQAGAHWLIEVIPRQPTIERMECTLIGNFLVICFPGVNRRDLTGCGSGSVKLDDPNRGCGSGLT